MASQSHKIESRGVTLVELLVVIAIISVLTAMMIPRLRTINKDRNIREAARVVGSVFANASQRAIAEGGAGVLLEKNLNFIDAADVNFSATTLYVMRVPPPYIGDVEDATADIVGGIVTIDKPLEHEETASPPRLVVQENDFISLNNGSMRYRLNTVLVNTSDPTKLDLELDDAGFLPLPPDTSSAGVPFVIHRQPQKLESSRVELPEGYYLDLRYSGPTLSGTSANVGSVFNQAVAAGFVDPAGVANQIRFRIDENGVIERISFYDNGTNLFNPPTPAPGAIVSLRMSSPLYFYVAADELDGATPIDQASNLWVTVNTTGGVNIGYSVPPSGLLDVDLDTNIGTLTDRILEARDIANKQQSAAQ